MKNNNHSVADSASSKTFEDYNHSVARTKSYFSKAMRAHILRVELLKARHSRELSLCNSEWRKKLESLQKRVQELESALSRFDPQNNILCLSCPVSDNGNSSLRMKLRSDPKSSKIQIPMVSPLRGKQKKPMKWKSKNPKKPKSQSPNCRTGDSFEENMKRHIKPSRKRQKPTLGPMPKDDCKWEPLKPPIPERPALVPKHPELLFIKQNNEGGHRKEFVQKKRALTPKKKKARRKKRRIKRRAEECWNFKKGRCFKGFKCKWKHTLKTRNSKAKETPDIPNEQGTEKNFNDSKSEGSKTDSKLKVSVESPSQKSLEIILPTGKCGSKAIKKWRATPVSVLGNLDDSDEPELPRKTADFSKDKHRESDHFSPQSNYWRKDLKTNVLCQDLLAGPDIRNSHGHESLRDRVPTPKYKELDLNTKDQDLHTRKAKNLSNRRDPINALSVSQVGERKAITISPEIKEPTANAKKLESNIPNGAVAMNDVNKVGVNVNGLRDTNIKSKESDTEDFLRETIDLCELNEDEAGNSMHPVNKTVKEKKRIERDIEKSSNDPEGRKADIENQVLSVNDQFRSPKTPYTSTEYDTQKPGTEIIAKSSKDEGSNTLTTSNKGTSHQEQAMCELKHSPVTLQGIKKDSGSASDEEGRKVDVEKQSKTLKHQHTSLNAAPNTDEFDVELLKASTKMTSNLKTTSGNMLASKRKARQIEQEASKRKENFMVPRERREKEKQKPLIVDNLIADINDKVLEVKTGGKENVAGSEKYEIGGTTLQCSGKNEKHSSIDVKECFEITLLNNDINREQITSSLKTHTGDSSKKSERSCQATQQNVDKIERPKDSNVTSETDELPKPSNFAIEDRSVDITSNTTVSQISLQNSENQDVGQEYGSQSSLPQEFAAPHTTMLPNDISRDVANGKLEHVDLNFRSKDEVAAANTKETSASLKCINKKTSTELEVEECLLIPVGKASSCGLSKELVDHSAEIDLVSDNQIESTVVSNKNPDDETFVDEVDKLVSNKLWYRNEFTALPSNIRYHNTPEKDAQSIQKRAISGYIADVAVGCAEKDQLVGLHGQNNEGEASTVEKIDPNLCPSTVDTFQVVPGSKNVDEIEYPPENKQLDQTSIVKCSNTEKGNVIMRTEKKAKEESVCEKNSRANALHDASVKREKGNKDHSINSAHASNKDQACSWVTQTKKVYNGEKESFLIGSPPGARKDGIGSVQACDLSTSVTLVTARKRLRISQIDSEVSTSRAEDNKFPLTGKRLQVGITRQKYLSMRNKCRRVGLATRVGKVSEPKNSNLSPASVSSILTDIETERPKKCKRRRTGRDTHLTNNDNVEAPAHSGKMDIEEFGLNKLRRSKWAGRLRKRTKPFIETVDLAQGGKTMKQRLIEPSPREYLDSESSDCANVIWKDEQNSTPAAKLRPKQGRKETKYTYNARAKCWVDASSGSEREIDDSKADNLRSRRVSAQGIREAGLSKRGRSKSAGCHRKWVKPLCEVVHPTQGRISKRQKWTKTSARMDSRMSDSESLKDDSTTKNSQSRRVSTQGTTERRRRSKRLRRLSSRNEFENPKSDTTGHSCIVRKKLFVKNSPAANPTTTERSRRWREPTESDYDNIKKRSMSNASVRIGFKGKRPILEILDDNKKSELEEKSKDSPPPSAKFRRINTQRRNRQKTFSKRSNLASSSAQKLRRSPRLKRKRRKLGTVDYMGD